MIFVHDYENRKWPGVTKSVNNFLNKNACFEKYVFDKKMIYSVVLLKNIDNKFQKIFQKYIKHIEDSVNIYKDKLKTK